MTRIFYAFLFLYLGIVPASRAQKQALCGFDDFHKSRLQEDAAYRQGIESMDQAWSEFVKNKEFTQQRILVENGDTIVEIPVVIHVVHTGGAIGSNFNPADTDLEQWIAYLNQVFDGSYPPYAGSGSAPLPIRFALAQRDPDCNPTNGIIRVNGNVLPGYNMNGLASSSGASGIDIPDLTGLSQWPPSDYYNIYVVNRINGEDGFTTSGQYVAGFALLGTGYQDVERDGAYMLAYTAEAGNITLPHELGHAFGLYHTFYSTSPGCPPNADCTQDGDMVCDTDPGESLLSIPCPGSTATNPCTGQPYGVNGVQHNLMNYTNCMANHFTQGQADRMRFMLTNFRPELMLSRGAVAPPVAPTTGPVASTCIPAGINNYVSTNIGPAMVHLDSIYSVTLGFLPVGGSSEYYTDFNDRCDGSYHTTLTVGQNYALTVSTIANSQFVKVYIDYNNDGDFNDPGEQVMDQPISAPDTFTVTITPPPTAVQSTPLRMRVIADNSTSTNPCGNLNYGQAEDFAVTVVPDNPLPLALLLFQGKAEGDAAMLAWKVNAAASISRFELERSRDTRSFTTIADIPFSAQQDYAYTDRMEETGAYYYRLKIFSEGKSDYSRVVALTTNKPAEAVLNCYPNPAHDVLTIRSSNLLKHIRLMTSTGAVVQSVNPGVSQYKLSLEGLASGIYLVRIIESDGSVTQKKVYKQ